MYDPNFNKWGHDLRHHITKKQLTTSDFVFKASRTRAFLSVHLFRNQFMQH